MTRAELHLTLDLMLEMAEALKICSDSHTHTYNKTQIAESVLKKFSEWK